MTALAAIWHSGGRADARADCLRAMGALRLYGAHGDADWDGGDVALGCCRHAMLAEDRFDRQPLTGGDGRFVMIADVRLDDREGLAEALGIDAAELRVTADAALLLRAWERWGADSFARLYGDYAFVLWDSAERQLVLARDHAGVRPLHYHLGRDFVAVASMPKGLHALPQVPRAADEVRAAEFLINMPEEGPRSFFEGVNRVEAGHWVTISQAGAVSRRHWQPERTRLRLPRYADYVEGMREQLDRAVAARLRGSDGIAGAHLSGGLDSSGVAATAGRLLAPDGRLLAFTAAPRRGYDGPVPSNRIGDESAMAARTAARWPAIEHIVVRRGERTMVDDFDRDYFLFDRPLVNTDVQHRMNAINAEAQRRGVTVMLTAVMGNASLSYDGMERISELAAQFRWIAMTRLLRQVMRRTGMRWSGALVRAFAPWLPGPAWAALNRMRHGVHADVSRYTAVNMDRFHALGLAKRAGEVGLDLEYRPRRDSFEARMWLLRRVDFGNYQKGVLAGWGIDLRDPLADRRLFEYCLSVPAEMFVHEGVPRSLARDALADRVPDEVIGEPRRGALAIDWHEDLAASRARLSEEVARLEELPSAQAALDVARLRRLIEQWPSDGWNTPAVDMDYRQSLIRGVASGHFLRKASGRNV